MRHMSHSWWRGRKVPPGHTAHPGWEVTTCHPPPTLSADAIGLGCPRALQAWDPARRSPSRSRTGQKLRRLLFTPFNRRANSEQEAWALACPTIPPPVQTPTAALPAADWGPWSEKDRAQGRGQGTEVTVVLNWETPGVTLRAGPRLLRPHEAIRAQTGCAGESRTNRSSLECRHKDSRRARRPCSSSAPRLGAIRPTSNRPGDPQHRPVEGGHGVPQGAVVAPLQCGFRALKPRTGDKACVSPGKSCAPASRRTACRP